MLGNDRVCLRSLLIFFLWHFPSECVGALGMCDTAQLPFMSSKTNQDSFPSHHPIGNKWTSRQIDGWWTENQTYVAIAIDGDGDEVGWLRKCKPLLPTDSQLPFLPLYNLPILVLALDIMLALYSKLYWHYMYRN